jgi:hypothetical protein
MLSRDCSGYRIVTVRKGDIPSPAALCPPCDTAV